MSFSGHSNSDVQRQYRQNLHDDSSTRAEDTELALILGRFKNTEFDPYFEYSARRNFPATFAPEYTHMIYLDGDETRLAKVMKTVAYVVTGENDDGSLVIERWKLRQHSEYVTRWVYE